MTRVLPMVGSMAIHTKAATLAAARKMIGVKGMPNAAWPISSGNYCMASVGLWLGIRTRSDMGINVISISAFRSHYHWPEYPLSKAQAGDLVLLEWEGDGRNAADHIGLIEKVGPNHASVTTIEGNTGPRVGVLEPAGFYRRTRYAMNIIKVVRPPYAKPAPAPKPAPKPVKGTYYVVVKGDTLIKIATKYKTTTAAIEKLNPSIKNPNVISVGEKIRVK